MDGEEAASRAVAARIAVVLDPVDERPVHREQHRQRLRPGRRDRRDGARRATAVCRRPLAEAPHRARARRGSGGRGPTRPRSTRTPCSRAFDGGRAGRRPGPPPRRGASCCRSPTSARRPATARPTACLAISSPRIPVGRARSRRGSRSCRPATPTGRPGCPRRGRPVGRRDGRPARRRRQRPPASRRQPSRGRPAAPRGRCRTRPTSPRRASPGSARSWRS